MSVAVSGAAHALASTSGRSPSSWGCGPALALDSRQLSRGRAPLPVLAASRDGLQARAAASPVPLRPLGPSLGLGGGGGPAAAAAASNGGSAAAHSSSSSGGGGGKPTGARPGGAVRLNGDGAGAVPGSSSKSEEWLDLLQTPEPDMFGSRARSASDAAVLRRKGHLKEQDKFIQFVLDMHQTHTSLEVGAQGAGGGRGASQGGWRAANRPARCRMVLTGSPRLPPLSPPLPPTARRSCRRWTGGLRSTATTRARRGCGAWCPPSAPSSSRSSECLGRHRLSRLL